MKVSGENYRSIWPSPDDPACVCIIDQRLLPHRFEVAELRDLEDGVVAIRDMAVRGAPLIGATAAWTLYLVALRHASSRKPLQRLDEAAAALTAARPTAINLQWAVDKVMTALRAQPDALVQTARALAEEICDQDIETNRAIGRHGLELIRRISEKKQGGPVNVLTHCNAGWLATVDWGTATSPIYHAARSGIDVHVWVDETRPRNQGALLTAWELGHEQVPHTIVADNAGGHLMQHGEVDICITGTDRTTASGDVANKIGTYLKALAATDNGVPFYVAAPSSSIDWRAAQTASGIPIEERDARELTHISGTDAQNRLTEVRISAAGSPARNIAFDVTPRRLVSGLITERGICRADPASIGEMFPEHVDDD